MEEEAGRGLEVRSTTGEEDVAARVRRIVSLGPEVEAVGLLREGFVTQADSNTSCLGRGLLGVG